MWTSWGVRLRNCMVVLHLARATGRLYWRGTGLAPSGRRVTQLLLSRSTVHHPASCRVEVSIHTTTPPGSEWSIVLLAPTSATRNSVPAGNQAPVGLV